MRRLASALLAGAVAAVVAAAVVDALGRGEPPPEASARLRAAGVGGELVWSDPACGRHAVRLPDLARREFRTRGCGVFTRRDSLGVRAGEVAWFAFPDPGGSTTLLSRADVAAQIGEAFEPVDAAWLGGMRYAAVFSGPRTVLALLERRTALALDTSFGAAAARVRASPGGRFYAGLGDDRVRVFDRAGRSVPLPSAARAIAWSPDERFAVLARGGGLSIVPAAGGEEIVRIPARAVDVDWRGRE